MTNADADPAEVRQDPQPCTWPDCGRFVGDCPHHAGSWEASKDQLDRMYRR